MAWAIASQFATQAEIAQLDIALVGGDWLRSVRGVRNAPPRAAWK